MDRNVVIGIVVVLALAVIGWWYWAFMAPSAMAPAPVEGVVEVPLDENGMPSIVGMWESKQDARFVRSFNADGTVVDTYQGEDSATATGTWTYVTDVSAEQPELPTIAGARYVKIQFPEEVLYFAVTSVTATDLSMIYLSGNGTLEFSRLQ